MLRHRLFYFVHKQLFNVILKKIILSSILPSFSLSSLLQLYTSMHPFTILQRNAQFVLVERVKTRILNKVVVRESFLWFFSVRDDLLAWILVVGSDSCWWRVGNNGIYSHGTQYSQGEIRLSHFLSLSDSIWLYLSLCVFVIECTVNVWFQFFYTSRAMLWRPRLPSAKKNSKSVFVVVRGTGI